MPPFKGGVHVDEKGYLRISAGPHRGKRVASMVMEAVLQRELLVTEDVHHKNGNKLDCHWQNLEVIDHAEHGYVSAKQGQFMKRKEAHEREEWNEYFGEQQRA